jgi:hypothetical protein
MGGGLDTLSQAIASAFDTLGQPAFFSTACFVLALVFVLSAVPKLRKPELAALAMVDFGVTRRSHPRAGLGLGVGELAIAAGASVAAGSTAVAPRAILVAVAATVLWVFAVLIARALRFPERFDCYCFGSDEQISYPTLVRTGALGVLATVLAFAAFQPSESISATSLLLSLVLAVAILSIVVLAARLPAVLEVSS